MKKRCSKCKVIKLVSEFSKNRTRKSGLCCQCKECTNARCRVYRQTHRVKIAKHLKGYRRTIEGYVHRIFDNMIDRCQNPKGTSYPRYGARGIEVCCTFDELFYHITVTLGYDTFDKLKGLHVDRIDTNDHYEISNLRIVTRSQNNMNARKHSNWRGRSCSSRFKGVCWDKQNKKWRVSITAGGIRHNLGEFFDETEAAKVYDAASLKYHGKFGATNKSLGLLD